MNTKLTKLVSSFYHFPAKSSTLNYFQIEHKKTHYNPNKQQGNIKTSSITRNIISQGI